MWNSAVESAFRRERPDVEFVDEVILERQAGPAVVSPLERLSIDHLGGPVDALRLEARRRVGPLMAAIEAVDVEAPRSYSCDDGLVVAAFDPLHDRSLRLRRED